jgi:mRNA-degrading endonuclease RelE of RelBE toxin-antitoxin system
MFKIIISSKAIKELKLLKFIHKESVGYAINDLKEDPMSGKKLKDKLLGKYSYRIGVYRIIYKINENNKTVYIISAGHRSIVYG